MLPTFLFPGAERVGSSLSTLTYDPDVVVHEDIDWYNPLSWYRAYAKARQGDLCIFEWWTSSVSHMYLCIAMFLLLRRVPLIMEFHEVVDPLEDAILPIKIYSRVMGRMIRGLCTRYIVHSAFDQALIAEKYGIKAEEIEIVPIGLFDQYPHLPTDTARHKLGIPLQYSKIILFFGLIRPYKGVSQLVEAFEHLSADEKEHTLLLIAGEPWEDADALCRIEASKDQEHIRLVATYISDEEIPYYFSAADVLVLPYTRASQSAVAHIGIAYGMPIIATKVGGLIESLSKYEGTHFVPSQNREALTESLSRIISENGESKTYEIPFSLQWDVVAARWVDVITRVCSDKNEKKD
jgi:glycosyltransferase involved in cell wall biosynthesis